MRVQLEEDRIFPSLAVELKAGDWLDVAEDGTVSLVEAPDMKVFPLVKDTKVSNVKEVTDNGSAQV